MSVFDFNRRGNGHNGRKPFCDPTTGLDVDKGPKV